jgi:hypothetical protein
MTIDHESQNILNVVECEDPITSPIPKALIVYTTILKDFPHAVHFVEEPWTGYGNLDVGALCVSLVSVKILARH